MAMNLAPVLKQRFFDANGNPLAGGKLYTYQAGTTTPQTTYTDSTGGTPNANPVVLDANGEASVWLNTALAYKFVLKDSSDVAQWTADNVAGADSLADGSVVTAKIANDAVTADKLKDDADIDVNRAVTTNHIRDAAITTAKLADNSVTAAKFKADAVTDANRPVTTDHIRDASVTTPKLAAKNIVFGSDVNQFSSGFGTGEYSVTSLTITTTTRPIEIGLDPIGTATGSGEGMLVNVKGVMFKVDGVTVATWDLGYLGGSQGFPVSSLVKKYVPSAGAHTIAFVVMQDPSTAVQGYKFRLYAHDL